MVRGIGAVSAGGGGGDGTVRYNAETDRIEVLYDGNWIPSVYAGAQWDGVMFNLGTYSHLGSFRMIESYGNNTGVYWNVTPEIGNPIYLRTYQFKDASTASYLNGYYQTPLDLRGYSKLRVEANRRTLQPAGTPRFLVALCDAKDVGRNNIFNLTGTVVRYTEAKGAENTQTDHVYEIDLNGIEQSELYLYFTMTNGSINNVYGSGQYINIQSLKLIK